MLEGIKQYWLCVGGANVDVQGVTSARLLPGTSNPGIVHQAAGGVARNVAEYLGWLGEEVHLYALVGEDPDGEWLRQVTADSGVATHGMKRVPGNSTGRYLAVRDTDGELYTAVSDMAINEAWTDSMVRDVCKRIPEATGLFLDANLPVPVMEAILIEAKREGKKVIADPVSVKKAKKWRGKLEGVFALVGSIDEMEAMSGQTLHSYQDVEKCAQSFVAGGITQVMVVCGEAGICLCNESGELWLPAPPFPIRETSGDAFAAGVIFAQDKTSLLQEQAAYGIALAEMSVQKKGMYDINEFLLRKEVFASKQVTNTPREMH
ncbi:carbohydrate kinase family protein [Brevibacillus choshinensis]|uniref:Carbohydrate kinase family protein n=1 Tax=Brevibacillus choshinensis TaxID=54911 RepID=A0ABX7FK46_BRECH|nr:carbohydrate kinase family protein [Brevibacillus choshinensis]QRG66057.1 carbohydrate kinase family protein [Brevibacillus choshinensis]